MANLPILTNFTPLIGYKSGGFSLVTPAESITVPNYAPFVVELNQKSSEEIGKRPTITGFAEVFTTPAAGQFSFDSLTSRLTFHKSAAGLSLTVTYYGIGSVVRNEQFTSMQAAINSLEGRSLAYLNETIVNTGTTFTYSSSLSELTVPNLELKFHLDVNVGLGGVKASQTLTFSALPLATDTVTITDGVNTDIYEFFANGSVYVGPNIGVELGTGINDIADTIQNFTAEVGGSGQVAVFSAATATTATITARTFGTAANSWTVDVNPETRITGVVGTVALSGGTDGINDTYAITGSLVDSFDDGDVIYVTITNDESALTLQRAADTAFLADTSTMRRMIAYRKGADCYLWNGLKLEDGDITSGELEITDTLGSMTDVTLTSPADLDILSFESGLWKNKTLANAGIAAAAHTHAGTDITSGLLPDARLSAAIARLASPVFTGVVTLAGGTEPTPSLHWGDVGTGIYRSQIDQLSISAGGTSEVTIGASGFSLKSGGSVNNIQSSLSSSASSLASAAAIQTALDLKSNQADVVLLAGVQSITGVKTFTDEPAFSATNAAGTSEYIFQNLSGTAASHAKIRISTSAVNGQASIVFNRTATLWTMGLDGADTDKFVLSRSSLLGTNNVFTADGTDVIFVDNVTIPTLTLTNDLAVTHGGTGASTSAAARTSLGVDAAGTDNSTNVTLSGTPDYITLSGQDIVRGLIVLTTDVSGILPLANGGTGASSFASAGIAELSGAAFSGPNTHSFTNTDSSGTPVALRITPTYNQTGTAGGIDLLIARTETEVGSGPHHLIQTKVDGVEKFTVDSKGKISIGKAIDTNHTLSLVGSVSAAAQFESTNAVGAFVRIKAASGKDAKISFGDTLTANLWNFGVDNSAADIFKWSTNSSGFLETNTQMMLTTGGDLTTSGDITATGNLVVLGNTLSIPTVAGAPTGGANGDIKIDTTNNLLYFKSGGVWKASNVS